MSPHPTRLGSATREGTADARRLRRHARGRAAVPARPSRRAGTSWSAWSPAPTRRPGAAAGWSPRRSPSSPRSSACPCSSRHHPREPDFQAALAELRPGVLPGRRLRRPAAPSRRSTIPAHGWVNLHFSLLPAWRGAAPVQHAIWAGDEVTGATTFRIVAGARRRADVRADDAGHPARPTPRATCSSGWPRAEPACSSRRSTGSRTAPSRPASSRPRGSAWRPRSPSRTPTSTGPSPRSAVDRRIRACTPAPGAWSTYAGERIKLGPVRPVGRERLDPGRAGGDARTPSSSARRPTRCSSAGCGRSARRRWTPPTGPVAPGCPTGPCSGG